MNKRSFIRRSILGAAALLVPVKAYNLEYYPMPSDKKWAILYGTWCGSARDASLWISEGMDGIANVFDVRENPDLSGYDNVVIGGAIRMNRIAADLTGYLEKNRDILSPKIRAYFAVCGNMMQEPGPEQVKTFIDDQLAKICGVSGIPSKVFPGRITFGLMEPEVRKQMQQMPGIVEYDNLKRSECMSFGRVVVESGK